LIAFERLEGRHTGPNIAMVLFGIIEDFGITEKLFCVTSNAVSNNVKMLRILHDILLE